MKWFDPITGEWYADVQNVSTNGEGMMVVDNFPDGEKVSMRDWSLKLISN